MARLGVRVLPIPRKYWGISEQKFKYKTKYIWRSTGGLPEKNEYIVGFFSINTKKPSLSVYHPTTKKDWKK